MKRLISLAICLLLLGACTDDGRFGGATENRIGQRIAFIPSTLYGTDAGLLAGSGVDTVELGGQARIAGVYSLGEQNLDEDLIEYYLQTVFWTSEGDTVLGSSLEKRFAVAGMHAYVLHAVDYLGDTLRDTIRIFVDSPLGITLLSPEPGESTLDPYNPAAFRWEIDGAEPWEEPRCAMFFAADPDSVWMAKAQEVDCHSPARPDNLKSGTLYYWGMAAYAGGSENDQALSSIRRFSTLDSTLPYARLLLPLGFLDMGPSAAARLVLRDNTGALLDSVLLQAGTTAILFDSLPGTDQALLRVDAPDYPEYQAKEYAFALRPGSLIYADTAMLHDSTPPRIWPSRTNFGSNDSLVFYAADQGAGLVSSTFEPLLGDSVPPYDRSNARLSLAMPCAASCRLRFRAQDFASNAFGESYWLLERDADSIRVKGPFASSYRANP